MNKTMKVKFLQGYGGRDTREIHYEVGQIVDEEHGAEGLVHLAVRGIVEILLDEPEFVPVPAPLPVTKASKSKKSTVKPAQTPKSANKAKQKAGKK